MYHLLLKRATHGGTVIDLGLFLVATFVAALLTGLVGFAFGMIATADCVTVTWRQGMDGAAPNLTFRVIPSNTGERYRR
jgi:hypothetical protein